MDMDSMTDNDAVVDMVLDMVDMVLDMVGMVLDMVGMVYVMAYNRVPIFRLCL
jgi:hypothetical protein